MTPIFAPPLKSLKAALRGMSKTNLREKKSRP